MQRKRDRDSRYISGLTDFYPTFSVSIILPRHAKTANLNTANKKCHLYTEYETSWKDTIANKQIRQKQDQV